jgi:hypothetical protein
MHVYFQTDGQGGIGASTRPNATKLGSLRLLDEGAACYQKPWLPKVSNRKICCLVAPSFLRFCA